MMALGSEPVSIRSLKISGKSATLWAWEDSAGKAYRVTLDRDGMSVFPETSDPLRAQKYAIECARNWGGPRSGSGRPQKLGVPRCKCGAMTLKRALARGHKCGE